MSLLITFILITSVFVLLINYYKHVKKGHKNFPPGPPRLPFIGSYWYLLKENYYIADVALSKLGKLYNTNILGYYLGTFPTITTFGYELCKEVLTREEFIGRNDTIATRGRSLGKLTGLFFVEQQYWREQKRFSFRHLRDFGLGRRFRSTEELFEREIKELIDILTSEPKSNDFDVHCRKGQILVPAIFAAPTLSFILHILVGEKADNRTLREIYYSILRFLRSGDATGGTITIFPWLRYIAPDFFGYTPIIREHKFIVDFLQTFIQKRKETFSDDHLGDFLDVYLKKIQEEKGEINSSFTEEQLTWVLLDCLLPTSVTIGQTLNILWQNMIHNSEIQCKIQEEIDRVVGRSRLPNLDDRNGMPYTEAAIREALRIKPINPLGIPRRCLVDTTLAGYSIPKDTIIIPHIMSAHNDPTIWKDPQCFKPERFLTEDGNLLKRDYILAFGTGSRVCIGETMAKQLLFLLVSGLLQNFSFNFADKIPDLNERIWGTLVSPKDCWVQATFRNL